MKSCLLALIAAISLLFPAHFVPPGASMQPGRRLTLNVLDFGAPGNGKTKDTTTIQHALDRCSVLGGCEVLFPPGDYLTGAITLRSNTTLRLERGATILGTPDFADYPVT